ncbi:N-acetylmannosaminyltransferase [Deltaproteobacteria bacterium]|nr:N-acetylmannosaminyltransferase [Deltaproteobacteria bacterium]
MEPPSNGASATSVEPPSNGASAPRRISLLGVPIDDVTRAGMLDRVATLVERGRAGSPATVAYVNVHVLDVAGRDDALVGFLNAADLVYCDGAGVVLGARLSGENLTERMTGADWIWDFAARAEGNWRVFWLGGEPGVTAEAASRLRAKHPRLTIEADHGFHTDLAPLIARINAFQPDILLVGMGTPTQEAWVARWRGALDAPVVWVLGATHDFVAGRVSRGPEWLHQRQEWLARLWVDPKRLWRRYLLGNGRFFLRVLKARRAPRP